MTAAISQFRMPVSAARRAPRRYPWIVSAFLCLCFFFANHNLNAPREWQETTQNDVNRLVNRMSEGQRLRQIAFLSIGVAGIIGIALPGGRRFRVDMLVFYPLLLLMIWCVLSIGWSQAPSLTAKRFVVLFAMMTAVIALVKRYSLAILPTIAMSYGIMALLLGFVGEAMLGGPFRSGYRFAGTMHPNHTGVCMVLLTLASLALADWKDKRRRWFFALAGFAFLILILTGSRTALFAGVFSIAVMTILRWPLRRLLLIGLPIVWTIGLFGAMYTLELVPPIWEKALLGRQDSDASTLTGRTDIWKFSLRHLMHDETRLMIGFGYDSFWTPEMARDVSRFVQFKISEGHSAYIDATLETGLIGASLYVFCLLVTFGKWCWYAWKSKAAAAAFAAAIPAFAIIHGFAESATIDAHAWTLLLFGAMAFAALAKPQLNAERPLA